MTFPLEKARRLLDDCGSEFLQSERGKCLKSIVDQLAAMTAQRDALLLERDKQAKGDF